MVRILLKHGGADAGLTDWAYGWAPAEAAKEEGHKQCYQLVEVSQTCDRKLHSCPEEVENLTLSRRKGEAWLSVYFITAPFRSPSVS